MSFERKDIESNVSIESELKNDCFSSTPHRKILLRRWTSQTRRNAALETDEGLDNVALRSTLGWIHTTRTVMKGQAFSRNIFFT